MTPFPKIHSSCPYLDRLDTVIDAGYCRMCRREVHDLSAMDEGERAGFLAACGGDACVSYTMNVKPALAAAMIAASAAVLAVPVAALAADHKAGRSHHRPRPPRVYMVPMMTAGLIMPVIDRRADPPPPPPPPGPPSPPQKPD